MRILLSQLALLALLLSLLAGCTVLASSRIEGAVKKALHDDARLASYSFEVDHQGQGEVLITGKVWSEAELAAVSEIAEKVDGVTKVLNRCSIEEQGGGGLIQDEVVVSPYL